MINDRQIRSGLSQNQFLFYYQPKVSLVTGELAGAEALIRWRRDDGALIYPADFIPVAERSDLIKCITGHMFEMLIDDIRLFSEHDSYKPLPISFNASARDFQDTRLIEKILDAIARYAIKPETIEVEITETEALEGGDELHENLAALCRAGIALTMDDYGTGYSSIDALSKLPFSTIKLDQGIVGRMLSSPKNAKIVQSSIRMGHELNLNVVAEGVETEEQYEFLLDAGCKMAQGYFISKPLPAQQFLAFNEQQAMWPSFAAGLVHMAIIDHIQWRRQLVRHVVRRAALPAGSPMRMSEGYPELSHEKCLIGQWYRGQGKALSGHATYEAVDIPHQQLHTIGFRLVEQIRSGASLDEIAPALKELTECSKVLLGLLECLDNVSLVSAHRHH